MGENARKSEPPRVARSPQELLALKPGEGYSQVDFWMWPLGGAVLGGFGMTLRNLALKRPYWAGLPFQVIMAGFSAFLFSFARDIVYANRNETEEIFRHYVALHPEEFPPFEPKRFRDIYMPFNPVR